MAIIIRFFVFFGFLLCLSGSGLYAKTDPFLPEKGFLIPDSFDGFTSDRALGAIFQNPARLSDATGFQAKIDTASDFLGYDRYTISALYDVNLKQLPFVVAVGHYAFYANDLIRTSTSASAANNVAVQGTFGDSNSQSVVALGLSLPKGFSVGSTVRYYSRKLDSASQQAIAFDAGVLWRYRQLLQVGAYTRNMLGSKSEWSTQETNALPSAVVAEIGLQLRPFSTLLTSDFDRHRLWAEYALSPYLSLNGDGVWESGGGMIRHGFGAILSLGGVMFQYQHLQFDVTNLSFSQDTLGVAIQFSPEKWRGAMYVPGQ